MTAPLRRAEIDAGAISLNVRRLRELATAPKLLAVVKADGYGHGALLAARAALAGGADMLGTADVAEALALREAGIDAPILGWLHHPHPDFTAAVARNISVGVSSAEHLAAAAAAGDAALPASVHLKLETGLARNGIAPSDWSALFERAAHLEREGSIRVEGIFSHLSGASREADLGQAAVFDEGLALAAQHGVRPRLRHLAASRATVELPQTHYDLVRPGVAIYGLAPEPYLDAADLGLRPAMTLRTSVAAVRRVTAGHGVSYGYTHRTTTATTLALVPVGYADGIPRQASSRGAVQVAGVRAPVVGRIAMDQFIVDVGDHAVSPGDDVVIFGDRATGAPSADEWAAAADTINYEIVTRIGARVERVPA